MKKNWAFRKDAEAVSPVIATILMVAITVVLAAVLYVMVLGFGGNTDVTPTTSMTKTSITAGYQFAPTTPTETAAWGDVTIVLEAVGYTPISWSNATTALLTSAAGAPMVWHYGSAKTLSGVSVWLNITDVGGNGQVNGGDYISITYGGATAWVSGVTYTVKMIYEPSDSQMGSATFVG